MGEATARALLAGGWWVSASMHTVREDVRERLAKAGARVLMQDVRRADWRDAAEACDALIFCTHLKLTMQAIGTSAPAPRIVAFSSNNVAIHPDAETYRALAEAENALRAVSPCAAIIRPTLIYGDPRLPTMPRLLRMARSWPIIPMPGSGRALAQPVFHEDLGRLAAGLAESGEAAIFAAGGPDIVSTRALFELARRITGGRGVIAPVPAPVLSLLSLTGRFSAEQTARAERDRLAIAQTPLPMQLAPSTPLSVGLARLYAAMQA